ncbi:hypothetical protein [Vibrio cholerae]|uniref:hypothetical protein n=1 Tax=Vibrio cholerae TaxID=666 RepID=UPI0005B62233|nr:hypothetical protein [Vibrio cholerae]WOQ95705.1 hypothetical protein R4538_07680 [Vibrio cholerae]
MHFLRKIFGKKKTVKRANITGFSGSGNSAMVYDRATKEWIYLYLLNVDCGCGHVYSASEMGEEGIREVAYMNNHRFMNGDEITQSRDYSMGGYGGSSESRHFESSSSDSYSGGDYGSNSSDYSSSSSGYSSSCD